MTARVETSPASPSTRPRAAPTGCRERVRLGSRRLPSVCYRVGSRKDFEKKTMSDPNLRSGVLRRASVRGAMIAGIVIAIALILLGLTGSFIVDWLWFGEVGYLGVFWTFSLPKAKFSLPSLSRLRLSCGSMGRLRLVRRDRRGFTLVPSTTGKAPRSNPCPTFWNWPAIEWACRV